MVELFDVRVGNQAHCNEAPAMPVKAEHAPYIVKIGQTVRFTAEQNVKECIGHHGIVVAKGSTPIRPHVDDRPVPDNMCLLAQRREHNELTVYLVRVISPKERMPAEIWCWRCGFRIV